MYKFSCSKTKIGPIMTRESHSPNVCYSTITNSAKRLPGAS